MGWFDTNNKHQQVIVTANAWDMQRIEDRQRRRKWCIVFNVVAVILLLIGVSYIYSKQDYKTGVVYIIIGLFILLFNTFKRLFRSKNSSRHHRRYRHRHRRRH